MLEYLKIKVTSLAAEAKLIRHDERKQLKWARHAAQFGDYGNWPDYADRHYRVYFGLRDHRKRDVRNESRSANIAYGILKGRKYDQIEKRSPSNKQANEPNWSRIRDLIRKYGTDEKLESYDQWRKAHKSLTTS